MKLDNASRRCVSTVPAIGGKGNRRTEFKLRICVHFCTNSHEKMMDPSLIQSRR